MAIEVEAPDGSVVEFPDGTPRETISGAMQKKFAPSASVATSAKPSGFGEYLQNSYEGLKEAGRDVGSYLSRQFAPDEKRPEMPSDADLARKLDARPPAPPQADNPDESRLTAQQRVDAAKARIADAQKTYDANKAFLDNRGPLQRASDSAVFALSQPIRATTAGQYGFGDLVPFGNYNQQEEDFKRANPGVVNALKQAAGVQMGIPALAGLGYVDGGFLNALRKPPEIKAAETANALAKPGASPAQLIGPEARLNAIQDFQDANIPAFGPALGSKGTARTARTIEEMPLIGGTVKVPKNAVELAAAAEKERILRDAGAAPSKDEAGLIAQGGLNRFRTAQLDDLERQRLQGLGVNPDRPQPASNPGTVDINRPSQLDTSQLSPAELKLASQAKVSLPQSARATMQDLSPADVQKIIDAPANETSFPTKQAALYRRADDAMPAIMKDDASRNPNLFAQRESSTVARGLLQQEASSGVKASILQGRFGPLIEKLTNPSANMTIDSMRAARTEIGRALAEGNTLDASLSRTQLKQLYGALTNDTERALVGVAARARMQEQAGKLPLGTADQADKTLHLTRIADRYTRQGMERMDRFANMLNAPTIEAAAQRVTQYLRENTQNVRALETAASALRPEEWRSVLGQVMDNLGKLTPGAKEAERVFSFERFATDFNKLSQSPRVQAVLKKGLGEGTMNDLARLARVSERMKYYETTKNYSGSAYTGIGLGTAAGIFHPATIAPVIGSFLAAGGAGKLLTSQAFVKWLTGVYQAQQTVGNSATAVGKVVADKTGIANLGKAIASERDPQAKALMLSLGHTLLQGQAAQSRFAGTAAQRQAQ